MNVAVSILVDAREMFDQYLRATDESFVRTKPLSTGGYEYPEATVQADCAAFAMVFTCLWRAIRSSEVFRAYYALKPLAFSALANMVTPDAYAGPPYAGFWVQKGVNLVPTSPKTEIEMRKLCRTLRNGFCHFNFRYINVAPRNYFQQLALSLPGEVIDPDFADNYRIFICDWDATEGGFMEAKSDTRIIETQFASLRYSLFRFLASFFTEPGRLPYKDILTLVRQVFVVRRFRTRELIS